MTYSDPASPPSYFAPPLDDKVNIAERPFFFLSYSGKDLGLVIRSLRKTLYIVIR
jgi:hypothetical protein